MAVNNRLEEKYKKASDALATLKTALDDMSKVDSIAQKSGEYPENIYKTFRDSLIQRFEYTFDTTWKYLCAFLEAEGRILEIKTPKAVFREAFKAHYLDENGVREAIAMVDNRNLTTHGYNETLIEDISKHIESYYSLMEELLKKTN
jgi:nucleotidyltransferase substrate binding protein (TIGR01987 family)